MFPLSLFLSHYFPFSISHPPMLTFSLFLTFLSHYFSLSIFVPPPYLSYIVISISLSLSQNPSSFLSLPSSHSLFMNYPSSIMPYHPLSLYHPIFIHISPSKSPPPSFIFPPLLSLSSSLNYSLFPCLSDHHS